MFATAMCNLLDWPFLIFFLTLLCEIIDTRLRRNDIISLPRVYFKSARRQSKPSFSPNKFYKRTYYTLPSFYPPDTHRNDLDYDTDPERKPELETSLEISPYKFKKYGEDYSHPSYHHHSYHHNDHHHHTPPVRHSSHSKHLYLPIPIQQPTGPKKYDFSFWVWPLIFIIILPLVLGAILLPLALVFLMNLIFLLFTMRNNNTIGVVPGSYNAKSSSENKSEIHGTEVNDIFTTLMRSYEMYNSENKSKL